jgi:prepilin-type N-terminal cleavage/methylation domain-containing protein
MYNTKNSNTAMCEWKTAARHGFTMVELLVVIAIIVILSGVLLSSVFSASDTTKVSAAAAMVRNLAIGLEQYKTQFGEYPKSDEGKDGSGDNIRYEFRDRKKTSDTEGILTWLVKSGFNYEATNVNEKSEYSLLDPWGNPYLVHYAYTDNQKEYPDDAPWDSKTNCDNWIGESVEYVIYSKGPLAAKNRQGASDSPKYYIFNVKAGKQADAAAGWSNWRSGD